MNRRQFMTVAVMGLSLSLIGKPPEPGAPNVAPDRLSGLEHGLTCGKVEERLGTKGWHQFSTRDSAGRSVKCFSYFRNDVYGCYYLVFLDNKLARICSPPPPDMVGRHTPYGVVYSPAVANPVKRVADTLNAPDLTGAPLRELLRPGKQHRQNVDLGLTAAFLATGQIWGKPDDGPLDRRFGELRKRMDPVNVPLGGKRDEVEKQLPAPAIEYALEGEGMLVSYGPTDSASRLLPKEFLWLTVLYHDGEVKGVFSRDFVDWDRIDRVLSGAEK